MLTEPLLLSKYGRFVTRSTKPPTYIDVPCTAVAGPLTMLTDSTELKSRGRPLPLEVMRPRTPLMKISAVRPRIAGFEGAPKFVVE